MAQLVKSPPAMWETWVSSLGQEDPLEKELATHSSIIAWRIPRTEEPGRLYSPWGCKESDMTEPLEDVSGKEIRKRGDTCIHMDGSLCCTVETNTII